MAEPSDPAEGDRPRRRAAHITPEGFARLKAEYEQLWRVERRKVTREVSAAAAQGDRSENAEYIYGKKRLREIDARLRFLTKRMESLTVVYPSAERVGRVFFGAWVTLSDEAGDLRRYRLVGPDESDASAGFISVDAPLGRALLGREEGDEVTVNRPRGRAVFEITQIEYEDPGP